VDGDTLDLAGAGRVRLLGIDAPELGAGFDTPAPFAREARDRLAALAAGRWVRLQLDGNSRDAYGRLLAYVIRTDGVVLNTEMVRAGLARVTSRRALSRLGELRRAEAEAQLARRGIWGARPAIPQRTYRLPGRVRPGTRFRRGVREGAFRRSGETARRAP
jgi:micrococcal nuclease